MAIVPEDGSSGCDDGEQIADYLRLVPSPWLQICSFCSPPQLLHNRMGLKIGAYSEEMPEALYERTTTSI